MAGAEASLPQATGCDKYMRRPTTSFYSTIIAPFPSLQVPGRQRPVVVRAWRCEAAPSCLPAPLPNPTPGQSCITAFCGLVFLRRGRSRRHDASILHEALLLEPGTFAPASLRLSNIVPPQKYFFANISFFSQGPLHDHLTFGMLSSLMMQTPVLSCRSDRHHVVFRD
ncbi:hypothetical protein BKA80DRAFT_97302 [Phyllosticta citrichinensis]